MTTSEELDQQIAERAKELRKLADELAEQTEQTRSEMPAPVTKGRPHPQDANKTYKRKEENHDHPTI